MKVPEDYKAHVSRIIDSKGFGRSQSYAALLTFIVDKSIEGNIPKESTIAMEVFGKDASFNSAEDTLVRVYVHNLRKKLRAYYKGEGEPEPYRIFILKGKYQAVFLPKRKEEPEASPPTKPSHPNFSWLTGVSLAFLFLSLFIHYLQHRKLQQVQPLKSTFFSSTVWLPMLEGQDPVYVLLGDIFVFEEYDSVVGRNRVLRDSEINSAEELTQLIAERPVLAKREPRASENPLLMKAHAQSLSHLLPVLNTYGPGASVRLNSRSGPENLQDGPLIFIGMYKTLGLLGYIFDASHFRLMPNKVELLHVPDSTVLSGSGDHVEYHTDIAYFAQFVGPNGHLIWVISALTDTGLSQLTQSLSDPEALQEMESQIQGRIGELPSQYEVLYEVKGFDRTHLEMALRFAYPLD